MKLNKKLIPVIIVILLFANTYYSNRINAYNDKIHFIKLTYGDAILLESNGKYALIDGGEDNDNPRGFENLEFKGSEEYVVDYIKNIAANKYGDVTLEFVVGTHSHSDHLGGLDTVINDPNILVKKGYIKEYDESKIDDYEINNWDNKEVYEQTINALKNEKAEIIQNINKAPFKLGDFTIQFFNTENTTNDEKVGENENSLGVKVSKGEQIIFLAGDINNLDGDEDRLAKEIGEVDILKIGHHGQHDSSSTNFLKTLSPKYSIVTGFDKDIEDSILKDLYSIKCFNYSTGDNGTIVITFDSDNFGLDKYSYTKYLMFENNDYSI